jgi:hypothetical protein
MTELPFFAVLAVIVILLFLGLRGMMSRDGRRSHRGPGPGASGAVYGMLNEDKRKAIEIIVEGRAEYRDQEHADDVPDEEESAEPAARQKPTTKQD